MRVLIYMVVFFVASQLQGQEKPLFDQATQHYADGDYPAAVKDYMNILSAGKTSTAVYFNLGNSFYKMDSLAPSIYYYNKALQLSPNDADVQNNLAFAKRRTIDAIENVPKTGLTKLVDDLISTLTFNAWAVLAIVFSLFFMLFGIGYYFTLKSGQKRLYFTLSVLGLIFGAFSVIFAYQQYNIQQSKKFAIVFAKEIGVHAEPNHNSTRAFTLHEGTKIKLLDDFNGYSKIELSDGNQGWIKEDAVKKL